MKNKKNGYGILTAVILVAVIAIGVFIVLGFMDKKETENPSTEWAVRHPEQTGPYYRCDTDLPRWCVTRWLLLQFVSPQDRWDFIDERIELKDAGLADQQWRRSLSALQ